MKRKLWYFCLLSLLSVFLFAGCGNKEEENNPNYDSGNYLSGICYAVINVDEYGPIYLKLDADAAPATVTNFVNLVNEGFYDGLTFHRIINGFMMQGGDPKGNGSGGSAYTIPGEFALNGKENPISHVRGTISMARTEDYNSASSQFFIVHEDSTSLDGSYAAFGQVVGGMDVVDAICTTAVVSDGNGTVPAENQPVITSILMVNEADISFDLTESTGNTITDSEEPDLPAPKAIINIVKVDTLEGFETEDNWVVDENGNYYILSSSEDLLSLGLYETDLSTGITYDDNQPLAYSSDIGANAFVSVQITVPETDLPSQLLIAEEHNGALGKYLFGYDANNDTVYLIPIIE